MKGAHLLKVPNPDAVNTALLGETGRYEGLLALLAYFGIFLLAAAVMSRRSVKIIFDILVGAGIVQGVVAVMQHIPCFIIIKLLSAPIFHRES